MKKNLEDVFLDSLAELSNAESQWVKMLPKMAKAATDEGLHEALNKHFAETGSHIQKLEEALMRLCAKPRLKKCPVVTGLIKKVEDVIAENKKSPAINAALIFAAQKAGHYKIASYGTLREWAH